jgi:cysteinyl-tRNA synthetase
MSMRLYNTLTGQVEPLALVTPGRLGLYVCGVTPYAESHVGHAMSLIVYDALIRYLRWPGNSFGGLDVTYVSNYTDVEDKLIARGAELGIDPLDLANQNIAQWEDEQRALGLVFPDERPRVTTHIREIVALIERLIHNEYAYATPSGDVYFSVRSDDDYGKLSHRNIEELRAGTRFDPDEGKEFPLDFALWKASKPGEPHWASPWGEGRPGWHIECSAMAQRYLGDTFDIHGGGLDLVFPHHENEVAQSESATGKPFARTWMHNGLVLRDGEKMSKSIGNVVSVREALDRWSPDALRLFVLSSGYRSPNNLTDEAMEAATRGVERLATALRDEAATPPGLVSHDTTPPPVFLVEPAPQDLDTARFVEAMDDDLNTAQALAALFDLARGINRNRDAGENVSTAQATLRELAGVLGLTLETTVHPADLDVVALSKLAKQFQVVCGGTDAQSTIEALLAHREEARRSRDFSVADGIRDGLAAAGVEVEDTPSGPRWSAR